MTRVFPTAFLATLLLAGCAAPPPRVTSVARPPVTIPAAAPPTPGADWRDIPLTPGGWTYAAGATGSAARFGSDGTPPLLILSCDRAARAIRVALAGAATGTLTITTSYASRDWPLPAGGAVSIAAADPFLDRIAFSRGRVSFAVAGLPLLVLPAWAEPARVIEDCRG